MYLSINHRNQHNKLRFKLVVIVSIILFALITACSSAKRTQEAINTGNYVTAINTAVTKLKENKTRKGNEDIILLLEEAFAKNTERELRDINFLKKDGNLQILKEFIILITNSAQYKIKFRHYFR